MKQELKDFLSFSRGERVGLLLLLALILLMVLANRMHGRFRPENNYDFSAFQQEVDTFLAARIEQERIKQERQWPGYRPHTAELFYFDPNTIAFSAWQKLGLKEWQIKVIMNYREKGGRFRSAEDLWKIYGINEADKQRLQPWVRIASGQEPDYSYSGYDKEEFTTIEINAADSASLTSLPGIGPYMAGNILRYRKKLGGYNRVEQLAEVYRMQPETFERIKGRIQVDTNMVVPGIRINGAGYYDLLRHPYINKTLAYSITAHRQQYGKYKSVDDFLNTFGMNDSLFRVLKPYLTLEE